MTSHNQRRGRAWIKTCCSRAFLFLERRATPVIQGNVGTPPHSVNTMPRSYCSIMGHKLTPDQLQGYISCGSRRLSQFITASDYHLHYSWNAVNAQKSSSNFHVYISNPAGRWARVSQLKSGSASCHTSEPWDRLHYAASSHWCLRRLTMSNWKFWRFPPNWNCWFGVAQNVHNYHKQQFPSAEFS